MENVNKKMETLNIEYNQLAAKLGHAHSQIRASQKEIGILQESIDKVLEEHAALTAEKKKIEDSIVGASA
jgi:regulator of replication initiation timing